VESNQVLLLLSEYIQSILDCYKPKTQQEKRECLLRNFPFMDPNIQLLIKQAAEYYRFLPRNPFEDANILMLFNILGIPEKKFSFKSKLIINTDRFSNKREENPNVDEANLNPEPEVNEQPEVQNQVPAQENGEREQIPPPQQPAANPNQRLEDGLNQ